MLVTDIRPKQLLSLSVLWLQRFSSPYLVRNLLGEPISLQQSWMQLNSDTTLVDAGTETCQRLAPSEVKAVVHLDRDARLEWHKVMTTDTHASQAVSVSIDSLHDVSIKNIRLQVNPTTPMAALPLQITAPCHARLDFFHSSCLAYSWLCRRICLCGDWQTCEEFHRVLKNNSAPTAASAPHVVCKISLVPGSNATVKQLDIVSPIVLSNQTQIALEIEIALQTNDELQHCDYHRFGELGEDAKQILPERALSSLLFDFRVCAMPRLLPTMSKHGRTPMTGVSCTNFAQPQTVFKCSTPTGYADCPLATHVSTHLDSSCLSIVHVDSSCLRMVESWNLGVCPLFSCQSSPLFVAIVLCSPLGRFQSSGSHDRNKAVWLSESGRRLWHPSSRSSCLHGHTRRPLSARHSRYRLRLHTNKIVVADWALALSALARYLL